MPMAFPRTPCSAGSLLYGVKPHLGETFKLSSDPFFIENVRDIAGLCLNPPDQAVMLCVDEKTRIQALNGTQRVLPLCGGYAKVSRCDCVRHGTTKLFAALDLTTGKVLARCNKRHRHQERLAFVQLIDRETSKDLDIHLVRDNYASYQHARCGPRLPGGRACTCTSRRPMARR